MALAALAVELQSMILVNVDGVLLPCEHQPYANDVLTGLLACLLHDERHVL